MEVSCEFKAWGHPNIRASHPTTLEITRESSLTPRGDCIIAVKAELGAAGLPENLKRLLRISESNVTLEISVEGLSFRVVGKGCPKLTLNHPTDLVVRKSSYTCPRTLMIHANRAAADMPRRMVEALRREAQALIKIRVEKPCI